MFPSALPMSKKSISQSTTKFKQASQPSLPLNCHGEKSQDAYSKDFPSETEEWCKKGLCYNFDKKCHMNHKCKALKLLLMEGNQPTPSAQEVAYVQELDGEVSNVFHDKHSDIWGYLTTSSPSELGALKGKGIVRRLMLCLEVWREKRVVGRRLETREEWLPSILFGCF